MLPTAQVSEQLPLTPQRPAVAEDHEDEMEFVWPELEGHHKKRSCHLIVEQCGPVRSQSTVAARASAARFSQEAELCQQCLYAGRETCIQFR